MDVREVLGGQARCDERRRHNMKYYISKPEDRDQMIMILARNGYTVRQGKEKKAGAKVASPFVEVILKDDKREI